MAHLSIPDVYSAARLPVKQKDRGGISGAEMSASLDTNGPSGETLSTMSRPVEALYESIGRRVAQLRARADLTQEQLGQMLLPPVTRASVANLEAGKQRVFVHTLVQLGNIFGVPVASLVDDQREATVEASTLAQELKSKLKVEDGVAMALASSLLGDSR